MRTMASKNYPYWSESKRDYYRIDSKGLRRYKSRNDSVVVPESSSHTSGSPSGSNLETITAGIESMSLGSQSAPFQVYSPDFYKRGRVFATGRQAPQTRGSHSGRTATSNIEIPGWNGSGRKFVVCAEEVHGYPYCCYVLPIGTYGGSGVAKDGVIKADHGIIYSSKNKRREPPEPEPEENPSRNEKGMCATAVRVDMLLPTEKLDRMSRVNYKTALKFDRREAVHYLGDVDKDSIPWLYSQYSAVQKQYERSNAPVRDEEDENESNGDDDDEAGVSKQMSQLEVEARGAKDAYRRMLSYGQSSKEAIASLAETLQKKNSISSWDAAVAAAIGRLRYPPDAIPGI